MKISNLCTCQAPHPNLMHSESCWPRNPHNIGQLNWISLSAWILLFCFWRSTIIWSLSLWLGVGTDVLRSIRKAPCSTRAGCPLLRKSSPWSCAVWSLDHVCYDTSRQCALGQPLDRYRERSSRARPFHAERITKTPLLDAMLCSAPCRVPPVSQQLLHFSFFLSCPVLCTYACRPCTGRPGPWHSQSGMLFSGRRRVAAFLNNEFYLIKKKQKDTTPRSRRNLTVTISKPKNSNMAWKWEAQPQVGPNWCFNVQIVVSPLNIGFSNTIDN